MFSLPEQRFGAAALVPLGGDLAPSPGDLAFKIGDVGFEVGDRKRGEILLGRTRPARLQLRLVHVSSPSRPRLPAQFGAAAGAMQARRMRGIAEHASIASGEPLYSRYP